MRSCRRERGLLCCRERGHDAGSVGNAACPVPFPCIWCEFVEGVIPCFAGTGLLPYKMVISQPIRQTRPKPSSLGVVIASEARRSAFIPFPNQFRLFLGWRVLLDQEILASVIWTRPYGCLRRSYRRECGVLFRRERGLSRSVS